MATRQSSVKRKRGGLLRRILRLTFVAIAAFYAFCICGLVAMKWIDPPTTMVQIERRVRSCASGNPYRKRYTFVPLSRMPADLPHAVLAAEDQRFYDHHGLDWKQIDKVVDKDLDRGKLGRGASTITQQLVKNLFLTTGRSILRKGVEFTLAPVADFVLGKRRTLELYLNVIEWGPGIYGAEAAAKAYYGIPAARLGRDQCARLAAIIPSPLARKPARMDRYSADIQERMRSLGW